MKTSELHELSVDDLKAKLAELTEEQNRAWNEMTGEPFTGEMLLPPQFGPPPGTGPVRPRPARL